MSGDKFGVNTPAVEEFLAQLSDVTPVRRKVAAEAWRKVGRSQVHGEAWDAAFSTGRDAAFSTGRVAEWDEARDAVIYSSDDYELAAAQDAARALVVRDLVDADTFDAMVAPMRAAGVAFAGEDGEVVS